MKEQFSGLGVYTTMGQVSTLLAIALRGMPHGPSRQECLDYIKQQRWLDIQPADLRPYPSSKEPRWQTMVSWAREALVGQNFIDRSVADCWQPTKEGLNSAVLIRRDFTAGVLDVDRCYMWTPEFKVLMHPNYTPSESDKERPQFVYEDELPSWRKTVRGTDWQREIENFTPQQMLDLL